LKYLVLLGALMLALTCASREATNSATMRLSAQVRANCVVRSPLGLDFGTYDPHAKGAAPEAVANALSIACTKGTPGIRVALDGGESFADSHRNLRDDANHTIAYEIYTGPDHATVWNMIATVAYLPTTGQPTAIPLYGRVLAVNAKPEPGHYVDTLLAMVNF
jgi:spore coat protein U-like protein